MPQGSRMIAVSEVAQTKPRDVRLALYVAIGAVGGSGYSLIDGMFDLLKSHTRSRADRHTQTDKQGTGPSTSSG